METDSALYLFFILILLIILGRMEWNAHLRNLGAVPVRIVVNGTRGKSSVTRLIGAGLRAGGFNVMAKTTGTKPRMVFNNRTEIPVIRLGKPNIREQLSIFKKAVKEGVDAVVLENMSLRPDLQWTEETKIVKPILVVITNVRRDHLDVMGPGLSDIARNFINAVPKNAVIITAEKELFPLMKGLCEDKGLRIIQVAGNKGEPEISEREMLKFPYLEQKENVALAVEVCENLGIRKNTALEEMYKCIPDPGILKKYDLLINNKKITLFNALAVNDPDSIHMIYQQIVKPAS
ncbi:MAG TPA: poly-gamma-glutamate synthase PgsB, partial [Nitrospiraceae bacterium]|nr:poly-gamma-glutamate synthase PgsB [Nitrospiraceae bacterium]